MSNIQGCGPRQRGWSWSLRGRWELCPPGFVSPGVTPVAGLTVSARGGQGPTSSLNCPAILVSEYRSAENQCQLFAPGAHLSPASG